MKNDYLYEVSFNCALANNKYFFAHIITKIFRATHIKSPAKYC